VYCLMHGVPLPSLGSLAFHILAEGIAREQASRIALIKFLTGLFGPQSGLSSQELYLLVTEYTEQVFQFKYNYKYMPVGMKLFKEQMSARMEDMRLLDKVSNMTVKDKLD